MSYNSINDNPPHIRMDRQVLTWGFFIMERIMGTPKSLSCNELLQLFSSRGMRVDELDSLKIQHILLYDEKGGQEKPTNGASIVILIVMELVKMINSKYNWNRIQNVISSICSNDEEAQLLGFKNKESVDLFR